MDWLKDVYIEFIMSEFTDEQKHHLLHPSRAEELNNEEYDVLLRSTLYSWQTFDLEGIIVSFYGPEKIRELKNRII